MATVRSAVRRGRTMQRVHIVREPLSDYLRFEIVGSYAHSVAAGEDVRIVPLMGDDHWPAEVPVEDFWLFDCTVLFVVRYDADGTWLGVQRVTEPPGRVEDAVWVRNRILGRAQRWADYVAARPDLAARVPAVSVL